MVSRQMDGLAAILARNGSGFCFLLASGDDADYSIDEAGVFA